MEVYKNTYSAEELCDVDRDVYETFEPELNPIIKKIPVNDSFMTGEFTVTITWKGDAND